MLRLSQSTANCAKHANQVLHAVSKHHSLVIIRLIGINHGECFL